MREKGIRPEIELFHPGHYWVVNELIRNGKITPPYFIQFVLGFQTSIYPTPANVLNLINELPPQSHFLMSGVGVFQVPMTALAIILGGHVRHGVAAGHLLQPPAGAGEPRPGTAQALPVMAAAPQSAGPDG